VSSAFWNIGKIPELRNRILFSAAILAVYRIGIFVSTPGVDRVALGKAFNTLGGTLFGIFNMFSGGAFEQASIFALGIMPYISSSIIMQLLAVVVPTLERLQKEGESGRRKINQYTRYWAIVLSVIQGFGVANFLVQGPGGLQVVDNPGPMFYFLTIRPQRKRQKQHQELVSGLNRGDKVMTAVEPAAELFSLCQFSLDAAFVEPPQRIKGDIARIYYYMANKYPAKRAEILNFHVRAALLGWCKADPLNDKERQRVQAVVQATGVQNPFLEQSCETLAANLLDPAPGTVHFPLPKTAQRPEPPSPKRIALKGSPAQEKTPALPRSERQNPPSGTKPPLPLPSTASAQL